MTARFDEHHDAAMADLLHALETPPEVDVPADFAARVMARVPQNSGVASARRARALAPRYGSTAVFLSLAMVLVAMLVIAGATGTSTVWATLQLVLLAQAAAYVVWIGFAAWRRQ